MVTYEITMKRAMLALVVGAAVGGFVMLLTVLFIGQPFMVAISSIWQDPFGWLLVGLTLAAMWGLGIVVLGIPSWTLLHLNGWRKCWMSVLLGALLPSVIVAWLVFLESKSGVSMGFDFSMLIPAGIGMLVGWAIWRIAYRKTAA